KRAKPLRLNQTWLAGMLETERKVGSTPSMVQGWRPYSATIQPSSLDIQGRGNASNASRRYQRCFSKSRLADSQKENGKKVMKKKQMPTMKRKAQNRTGTLGTVSHAAFSICSGVASVTLGA